MIMRQVTNIGIQLKMEINLLTFFVVVSLEMPLNPRTIDWIMKNNSNFDSASSNGVFLLMLSERMRDRTATELKKLYLNTSKVLISFEFFSKISKQTVQNIHFQQMLCKIFSQTSKLKVFIIRFQTYLPQILAIVTLISKWKGSKRLRESLPVLEPALFQNHRLSKMISFLD